MIKTKLAAQVAQLSADRVPFVLATVVRARRPTSVTPGDTAIVLADGTIAGFVGGQCAESSVRLYSLRALETGEPLLLRLIPDGDDNEQPADGIDGVIVERNPCMSGGAIEIFLEPQLPIPRIVIFGESLVAKALRDLAVAGGYDVVATPTAHDDEVKAATAVVVASHGNDEERVLTAALSGGVPYVALVASNKRGAAVRESLDLPPELTAELHTPAGVDIGAQTPAEIAISILAELIVIQHAEPATPVETSADDAAASADDAAADRGEAEGPEREPDDGEPEEDLPVADPLAVLESETVNGSAAEGDGGEVAVNGSVPEGEAVETAIDPVCGMKVAITESTQYIDVGDARVYFCGAGCRLAYAAPQAPDAAKR
jgi:xanthine dehydrogenase accessory factor